jgi:hypothetical protein
MADAIAHPGGDRLDAEVVTVPDDLEQRDARGRHPQAGTAQLLGGAGVWDAVMAPNFTLVNTNDSRQRMVQA